MPSVPNLRTNVLLRSEETGGHASVTEIVSMKIILGRLLSASVPPSTVSRSC
jgi:hypothetical protein